MENEAKARAPRSRERGKGKNNKGTTRVLFQVSCQPEEREQIKELAEKAGKTTSKFLVDLALGRS
ncbi:hypothetical protein [uncultured Treponema sp.]|uniref:plasmid mobilization protein n=1 Tax=uncultured Treponema sp. TaxID=162155 RepID=UPI00258863A8|nr:hypothetical protein [uncultured Treponema sp.]